MPIDARKIRIGDCYSALVQGKNRTVKVLEISSPGDVRITENADRHGAKTTVSRPIFVKWAWRDPFPRSKWIDAARRLRLRAVALKITSKVPCN